MSENNLNLYVSPSGNDGWTGSVAAPSGDGRNGPLATLAGARNAVRHYKTERSGLDRPVTVHVAAGVYELAETLCFTPEDSGTADCPIRYVAADGAAPVISGGRRITGWQETQHNGMRCWIAELPEVAAGTWDFTRLYMNDMPRERPRLPKTGFQRFTGLAGCADSGSNWCQGPDRANFAPGEIRRWHNWEHVELVSYQHWFETRHRFKAIDEDAGVVHFHAKSLGSLRDECNEFARYFVENVFEAMDTPGQWYLDRPAGRLYYLPLPHETLACAVIVAPRLEEIIRLQGNGRQRVTHLHFENLVFSHQHWALPLSCPGFIQAAFGVPGAVILEGAEACVFYGCTIAHVNGYGLEVLVGSTENVVAACTVHDAGAGGIKIGHEQFDPHESAVGLKQVDGGHPAIATTVVDCTIRDCGHVFPSAIGIWVGNSGWNRLIHNRIFNCNYTGISCGFTWGYAPTRTVANRIEYNHIHHINDREILSDNGGIYTLGQQPGTVLRGNVIHDISCHGYGAWGIYPDEGSSEMRVEQNLVCGTKKSAYATHYGRDNLVQNNIFALSKDDHLCLGKREAHRSTLFRRNVVVTANGRMPADSWAIPQFTVSDNLFWSLGGDPFTFGGCTLEWLQAEGQHAGMVVADPLFADAPGGDFALRPDSSALGTGFRPFDWQAAGPRLVKDKPFNYGDYAKRFTLPDAEVPVIRTRITLVTPLEEVELSGRAEFIVTLTNIGRATGKNSVRLASGPKGATGHPSVRRIAYALQPGGEITEHVAVKVNRGTRVFWLDSEPSGTDAVPARGLVLDSATVRWQVPVVAGVESPEKIGKALARVTSHRITHVQRTVAEVKLAAAGDGLLLFARFHEPDLRPNLVAPWTGTSFELLAYHPKNGAAAELSSPRRQVCLVPRSEGIGADAVQVEMPNNVVVPVPEIRACAQPMTGGCEVAAMIPWKVLGHEQVPFEAPFEMVVNAVDSATGAMMARLAFNRPWAATRQYPGKLELTLPPAV